jgi:ATP-dependent Clp protease ATP-binding subunit ClpA
MLLWSEEWLQAINVAETISQQSHADEVDTTHILLALIETSPDTFWHDLGCNAATVASIRQQLRRNRPPQVVAVRESRLAGLRRRRPKRTEFSHYSEAFLTASMTDLQTGRLRTPLGREHLLVVVLQPGSRATRLLEEHGVSVGHLRETVYESLLV